MSHPPQPSPAPAPPAGPGQSVIVPADRARPRKLSDEFAMILREFEVENVTLREVFGVLHGRGYLLLVMLIALPFCTPGLDTDVLDGLRPGDQMQSGSPSSSPFERPSLSLSRGQSSDQITFACCTAGPSSRWDRAFDPKFVKELALASVWQLTHWNTPPFGIF